MVPFRRWPWTTARAFDPLSEIQPEIHAASVSEFLFIQPCSPIRAKTVPAGDGWVHEVKFDGYRVQAHKLGSVVALFSRNGHDFTERFASIAALLREMPT